MWAPPQPGCECFGCSNHPQPNLRRTSGRPRQDGQGSNEARYSFFVASLMSCKDTDAHFWNESGSGIPSPFTSTCKLIEFRDTDSMDIPSLQVGGLSLLFSRRILVLGVLRLEWRYLHLLVSQSHSPSLKAHRRKESLQGGWHSPTAPIMQLHMIIGSWWSIVLNHDALDIFEENPD